MSKNKARGPFHMSDVDSDVPILPEGTNVKPEDQPEDATFVDIGTIQTDPRISQRNDLCIS